VQNRAIEIHDSALDQIVREDGMAAESLYCGIQAEMRTPRHLLAWVLLLCMLVAAQTPAVERYVVLPPRSQPSIPPVLLWDEGSYASWTPSKADIESIEQRIPQISKLKIRSYESTHLRIENPEKYFRQYVGVRHNGKRRIYINAFCDDSPPPDWRLRLYVVIDGATCYWHVFYDPESNTFSDLTINARA